MARTLPAFPDSCDVLCSSGWVKGRPEADRVSDALAPLTLTGEHSRLAATGKGPFPVSRWVVLIVGGPFSFRVRAACLWDRRVGMAGHPALPRPASLFFVCELGDKMACWVTPSSQPCGWSGDRSVFSGPYPACRRSRAGTGAWRELVAGVVLAGHPLIVDAWMPSRARSPAPTLRGGQLSGLSAWIGLLFPRGSRVNASSPSGVSRCIALRVILRASARAARLPSMRSFTVA